MSHVKEKIEEKLPFLELNKMEERHIIGLYIVLFSRKVFYEEIESVTNLAKAMIFRNIPHRKGPHVETHIEMYVFGGNFLKVIPNSEKGDLLLYDPKARDLLLAEFAKNIARSHEPLEKYFDKSKYPERTAFRFVNLNGFVNSPKYHEINLPFIANSSFD